MSTAGQFSWVNVGGNGQDGILWLLDAAGTGVVTLQQWGFAAMDPNLPNSKFYAEISASERPLLIYNKDGTPTLQFLQDPSFGAVSLSIGGPGNPGFVQILDGSGNAQFLVDAAVPGNPFTWIQGNAYVGGDVILEGADCAEQFDVRGSEPEPGTVLVIDRWGSLHESRKAYDKRVAGVVSGAGDYKHSILLDNQPDSKGRVAVSLVGKVYCKVDAKYSPVKTGDLLTTSPTAGHAMRAINHEKAFGAVIGKALKPLRSGRKLIPILISLQ